MVRAIASRSSRSSTASAVLVLALASFATAESSCAETPQLSVMGSPPPSRTEGTTAQQEASAHSHHDSTMALPSDVQVVEPSQPFVASAEERALVHIHTPSGVCSGVVLGPRLIATAHQCVGGDAQGVSLATAAYRVEVASGSLTWATRTASHVVAPGCGWEKLDLALLVLSEPVPWVKPVKLGTAPGPGAEVQALGFGRCAGENQGIRDKKGNVLNVQDDALVIDVGLCKGDVGGPVVGSVAGELIGVVSHQDDPDDSPRHTTTIFRADTTIARDLVTQAQSVAAGGGDVLKLKAVACE